MKRGPATGGGFSNPPLEQGEELGPPSAEAIFGEDLTHLFFNPDEPVETHVGDLPHQEQGAWSTS